MGHDDLGADTEGLSLADRGLGAHHDGAQDHEHQREGARQRCVEADLEGGVDLRGERPKAQHLEGAVLSHELEGDEQAATSDRHPDLGQGDPPEDPSGRGPEAARHLLSAVVDATEPSDDREHHEGIGRQGQDEHRAPQAPQPRCGVDPPEGLDEVRDRGRDQEHHEEDTASGHVGALEQPRCGHAQHGGSEGGQHRHLDRVDQEREGQLAEEDRRERRPPDGERLREQEPDGRHGAERDQPPDHDQDP